MLAVKQSLQKIDFFGQSITMNMNKQNLYTTKLGGFSSLMIVVLLGVFFYSSIADFLTKQKATAIIETEFSIEPEKIVLNDSNFMTAFSISQTNFTDRPLFNITLEQRYYQRQEDGTIKKIKTFLKLQPCTLDQFTTKVKNGNTSIIESQFIQLGMQNWLCPKEDYNFTVQGAFGSKDFYFMKITVLDCINSTYIDNSTWSPICASIEDYNTKLQTDGSFKLQIYSINTVVNPTLPDNYLQVYLDSDMYFTFIPKIYTASANIYYRKYSIFNDDSISPFQDVQEQDIFVRTSEDFRDMSMTYENKGNYAEIFIRRSLFSVNISRRYQKVGELLSYLGGFMQITRIIFGLFIAFYNRTSLLIELSNKLYDFKEDLNRTWTQQKTTTILSPKYNKETFKLKTCMETERSDGEVRKKRTNTMVKKNVFQRIIKKSEPIRFSGKLFLNQLTCGMLFNERNSKLLKKAIEKMNEDLDLHSILFKINEINKLKEVIFNQSQMILFNFTPKPIITLNDDQVIPTRMNFEDEEAHQQEQHLNKSNGQNDAQLHNILYQAYIDLVDELEVQNVTKCQLELDLKLINLLGPDITKIFSQQLQMDSPHGFRDFPFDSRKSSVKQDAVIESDRDKERNSMV